MEPICAPATPLLSSPVTIVRVSGDRLDQVLKPLIKLPEPRSVSLRRLEWDTYSDLALVLYFPAPHSYTGQDVVEFQLHGNPLLVRRFIDYLSRLGIRLARCGEFTQRALLNGRQDLLGVEALKDLMDATSDTQIRQAQARSGGIPAWLRSAKGRVALWVARAEAAVDYGEDENISLNTGELKRDVLEMNKMFHVEHKRSESARWLRDGIRIAIVGRPNAGKSTLFNALAGEDRAIVTEIPGTTRDVLDVKCEWAGLPLCLFDTAGLRQSDDPIERLGIDRVDSVLEQADLVLHLRPATDCDSEQYACGQASSALKQASQAQPGIDPEIQKRLAPYQEKVLVIRNKCDLSECDGIRVSAISGNLDELKHALTQRFLGEFAPDACLGALATTRQRELLADLIQQMELISDLPDDCPAELPASLLQGAWGLITRLTGEDRADTTLDALFSGFCLGK